MISGSDGDEKWLRSRHAIRLEMKYNALTITAKLQMRSALRSTTSPIKDDGADDGLRRARDSILIVVDQTESIVCVLICYHIGHKTAFG